MPGNGAHIRARFSVEMRRWALGTCWLRRRAGDPGGESPARYKLHKALPDSGPAPAVEEDLVARGRWPGGLRQAPPLPESRDRRQAKQRLLPLPPFQIVPLRLRHLTCHQDRELSVPHERPPSHRAPAAGYSFTNVRSTEARRLPPGHQALSSWGWLSGGRGADGKQNELADGQHVDEQVQCCSRGSAVSGCVLRSSAGQRAWGPLRSPTFGRHWRTAIRLLL